VIDEQHQRETPGVAVKERGTVRLETTRGKCVEGFRSGKHRSRNARALKDVTKETTISPEFVS